MSDLWTIGARYGVTELYRHCYIVDLPVAP